jgi:hypothetical protein
MFEIGAIAIAVSKVDPHVTAPPSNRTTSSSSPLINISVRCSKFGRADAAEIIPQIITVTSGRHLDYRDAAKLNNLNVHSRGKTHLLA